MTKKRPDRRRVAVPGQVARIEGATDERRSFQYFLSTINDELVTSVRLVQMKCERCPHEVIGVVSEERYASGRDALVVDVLQHGEMFKMTLDPNDQEPVTFYCAYPQHGAAHQSVQDLRRKALRQLVKLRGASQQSQHRRRRSRRAKDNPPSEVVLLVTSMD